MKLDAAAASPDLFLLGWAWAKLSGSVGESFVGLLLPRPGFTTFLLHADGDTPSAEGMTALATNVLVPACAILPGDTADALHIRSAARYKDGSSVTPVTLEPTDGIVLALRLKGIE
jgi:hypothetical protein